MGIEPTCYDTDEESVKVWSIRLHGASITCRETRRYDDGGWRCVAVLAGNMPPAPEGECNDEGCWSRRPCDYCAEGEIWQDDILRCVRAATGWGLYDYYSGPGRRFAHGPCVYERGSRVKVTWSGGLDI